MDRLIRANLDAVLDCRVFGASPRTILGSEPALGNSFRHAIRAAFFRRRQRFCPIHEFRILLRTQNA
jgi:hypothetical protein